MCCHAQGVQSPRTDEDFWSKQAEERDFYSNVRQYLENFPKACRYIYIYPCQLFNLMSWRICINMHILFAVSVTHHLNTWDIPPRYKAMTSPSVTHYLHNRYVLLIIHELEGEGGGGCHDLTGIQTVCVRACVCSSYLFFSLSEGLLPVPPPLLMNQPIRS